MEKFKELEEQIKGAVTLSQVGMDDSEIKSYLKEEKITDENSVKFVIDTKNLVSAATEKNLPEIEKLFEEEEGDDADDRENEVLKLLEVNGVHDDIRDLVFMAAYLNITIRAAEVLVAEYLEEGKSEDEIIKEIMATGIDDEDIAQIIYAGATQHLAKDIEMYQEEEKKQSSSSGIISIMVGIVVLILGIYALSQDLDVIMDWGAVVMGIFLILTGIRKVSR